MLEHTLCNSNLHIFYSNVKPGDFCKCGEVIWDGPNMTDLESWKRYVSNKKAEERRKQFKFIKGGKQ